MNKLTLLFLVLVSLSGCATYEGTHDGYPYQPAPGSFGALCGFHENVDHGQCSDGLECFGTCTVNCESQEGIDECAAREGTCSQYAPEVQIDVCRVSQ